MKWIWVIILVVIGLFFAFAAVEYLSVSIHQLPHFFPGYHVHKRGHSHKRGAVAAVIAVIAFAVAGYLAYRLSRADPAEVTTVPPVDPTPADSSASDLLSNPSSTPGTSVGE